MHPSTALASVIVDELVRGGVQEAVLAPGSRSAPLAYALEAAHRAGRLRLHVRVDERSAGFLALGLARASGLPVPVVTTSGTAVANLHPAVLEAHHGGVPLVVVSADRPAELRGTGANQTTVQPGIFGGSVRWEADVPAPGPVSPVAAAHWRSTVCRALAAALGWPSSPAGPVHLNVSFRDPLAPDLASREQIPPGRDGGGPWTVRAPVSPPVAAPVSEGLRTVVLLGDLGDRRLTREVLSWAAASGWPVLAEPFGMLPAGATVVPHGVLVAARVAGGAPGLTGLVPDRVVVVGRLTLFRELGALSRRPGVRVEQVTAVPQWTDPGHVVHLVHGVGVLRVPTSAAEGAQEWVSAWLEAGRALSSAVQDAAGVADAAAAVTGAGVAATVAGVLGEHDVLVLGSSNAPRDLALVLDPATVAPARVIASRGLAGIDGTVSTAVGVALAVQGRGSAEQPSPAVDDAARDGSVERRDSAVDDAVRDGSAEQPSPAVDDAVREGSAEHRESVHGGSAEQLYSAVDDAVREGSAEHTESVHGGSAEQLDSAVDDAPHDGSAQHGESVHGGSAEQSPGRRGRVVALLGDLTFLHDTNGLLIGPTEVRPDLTLVVVNDGGGGIFSTLEYGEPTRSATAVSAAATERLFGTPHGADLGALCAAHHVSHVVAHSLAQLRDALAEPGHGIRVVEVPVDRAGHRPLRDRLR